MRGIVRRAARHDPRPLFDNVSLMSPTGHASKCRRLENPCSRKAAF